MNLKDAESVYRKRHKILIYSSIGGKCVSRFHNRVGAKAGHFEAILAL